MIKRIIMLILVSFLMMPAVQPVSAAAPEWKFDTVHSRFYFSIDHIFAKVIGYFEDFSGTIRFDAEQLQESSFDIKIETKSINTGITKRDNHLRTDEFFSVKDYPYITFKSRRITHKEGNQYLVEGELTIKDVTKQVTLPLTFLGIRDNPVKEGEEVAGFETRITFDRFDYHVGTGKFYKLGVAGKDVDIIVSLELLRDK